MKGISEFSIIEPNLEMKKEILKVYEANIEVLKESLKHTGPDLKEHGIILFKKLPANNYVAELIRGDIAGYGK
jgi:predicted RNA-binding protein with PUA domain